MAKWRVWNKHTLDHKELFRGDKIEIPAGKFVLMDYEDAHQFKGQYVPMKFDAMEQQTEETKKILFLEPDDKEEVVPKSGYVCQMDGKAFNTKAELEAYTAANYKDLAFKDDSLDEEIAKVELKKKPGRPAKEKTL